MPTTKKDSAKKPAAKPAAKKPASKAAAAPAKKPANLGFMKPMQPSAELAAIVGSKPLPRTEVTKKIWEYIKSHDLQIPENKRMIKADAKLLAVLGKKEVTMFEMTKLVNQHLS